MNVYVIGLGHVGLPMACFAARAGKSVIGVDIDPHAVEAVRNGTVKIHELCDEMPISRLAKELIAQGTLAVTGSLRRRDEAPGVFVVSVGIKSSPDFAQDTTPIVEVVDALLPQLVAGDLVIFRTTLIPGTMDEYVVPRIKELNRPVHLAYCPETIAENNAFAELDKNPILIGGIDQISCQKAEEFFRSISHAPVYFASSIKVAELVKVVQNINRDVEVAFINEISEAARVLGVDIYEVISLVNTHPRVKVLQPGPGVGGYCLPNALIYLQHALAGKPDAALPLSEAARDSNLKRPRKIVGWVEAALRDVGKELNQASVAIIGLAMKDNCADTRYSPAVAIAGMLQAKGAEVRAYDPLIGRVFPYQCESFEECIAGADCLLLAAVQPGMELAPATAKRLLADPALVVDTRNVFPATEGIKVCRI